MAVGPELEPMIENIMAMGFERDQVIVALRAAFFNPDRAIDYLINGIPEHLQNQAPPAPGNINAGDDDGEDDNEGDGGNQGQGGVSLEGVDENTINQLRNLINNPAFVQLRQQVRQNPQILPTILAYLQQNNPDLYNVIFKVF